MVMVLEPKDPGLGTTGPNNSPAGRRHMRDLLSQRRRQEEDVRIPMELFKEEDRQKGDRMILGGGDAVRAEVLVLARHLDQSRPFALLLGRFFDATAGIFGHFHRLLV